MMSLFFVLSILSVVSALCVVLFKNPIYSVLSLIVCFFSIAGHFLLLQSEFLAVVQVIVYAGAIMVLFLFILMLINLTRNVESRKSFFYIGGAGLVSLIFCLILLGSLTTLPHVNGLCPFLDKKVIVSSSPVTIQMLGKALFSEYSMPFEFASLLFLAAVVGVVVLSKKSKENS